MLIRSLVQGYGLLVGVILLIQRTEYYVVMIIIADRLGIYKARCSC